MLQFQYDRWLFKTVCGAVESAKKLSCTPRQALDSKTFTKEHWKWHHLFLIDGTRQYGYPSIFLTMSVAEWRFPTCTWMDLRKKMTSSNFQKLPYDVTVHVMHVLEQYARGYLSGGNDSKNWKTHVFADSKAHRDNIKLYFYRFEFQKRGPPHLHMLIWLHNCKDIDWKRFSASVPRDFPDLFI